MTDVRLPAHLEAFLNAQRLARLATVDAKPKRVPVRELRRVRNLIANPHVQLLVDIWDEDWTRLAYLQLRGVASVIESGPEQADALRLLRGRYAQYATMPLDDAPVIRIAVESYLVWGAV